MRTRPIESPRLFGAAVLSAFFFVISTPAAAQSPTECRSGQAVADAHGNSGVVVGMHTDRCLVKYEAGQIQRWVSLGELSIIALPARLAPLPTAPAVNETIAEGVKIVRPNIVNRLVYRADALGHIVLTASVNGAPVRFLVDTGATLVSLTPKDASAAGVKREGLTFDRAVQTGNGEVKAAFTQVRSIRLERLDVDNVQVAVVDNLKQSVLGMSFLRRLKAFEMRDGELSLVW